jgi:hypothetical protein
VTGPKLADGYHQTVTKPAVPARGGAVWAVLSPSRGFSREPLAEVLSPCRGFSRELLAEVVSPCRGFSRELLASARQGLSQRIRYTNAGFWWGVPCRRADWRGP